MAVETMREFAPADRYIYDFYWCTTQKGWAQIDTRQDASYYGNWVNPEKRLIFSYVEGDTTLIRCDTDDEFVAELRNRAEWHKENEYWMGIDPGFSDALRDQFTRLGLGDLFHSLETA